MPPKRKSRRRPSTTNIVGDGLQLTDTVPAAAPASERLFSLDAYRGFVILLMIWVNYLGGMAGIPTWLEHAKASEDTFTIPDLVFPGFLLMVGMAIPLALGRRLEQGASAGPMVSKMLWRSLGLIVAGVFMVNADRYDEAAAFLKSNTFYTLFYVALLFFWQEEKSRGWKYWLGALMLAVLAVLYRGKAGEGGSIYLEHSWWGILGLLGWAYLACGLLYLICRGNSMALMGIFAFQLVLYLGGRAGRLDFLPEALRNFIGIGDLLGSTSANVMAGAIVGKFFLDTRVHGAMSEEAQDQSHRRRMRFLLIFSASLLAAGLLLRPYHGISKIGATTSFTLVTAAINLLGFALFYALIDVSKWRAWSAPLALAGTNALLAYILPDLWNRLTAFVGLGGLWWSYAWHWLPQGGNAGLLNAAGVALFMLALTALGSKLGLKLKL